ncbi:glycerol-3-phosphate dehydrogenase [Oceanicella sp. SM1341]|uniref:glycerol-3-phosphate dehydrogenase n=1 Tax=Oceanicella sp. SM1341 TaxID=1548889 RepID=UPI000E502194|nr:glycerol-3-phosphate dehydrogenase [Oceanicella sp. SM1341]
MTSPSDSYDLLIIGGGVNGCGIARDAAGRGLSVLLAEQGDLAQATSSSSTKLFHGGLRYLEYYEFRLVREALIERETLLVAMPHISWPLRFVLPHHKGLRPAWLLRLGLFIYDHLGGRKILPATRSLDLTRDAAGKPLKPEFRRGFEYSDCWVEDSRLVALNARDAAARGARICTRVRVEGAERQGEAWQVRLRDMDTGAERIEHAKAVVNAAGPWVDDVLRNRVRQNSADHIRLVRGSHIVTKRLFEHDRPYIFQQADGRIIFAIPYETDFTLIGTTDQEHKDAPGTATCTPEEQAYLLKAASEYFAAPLTGEDVVWTYSGVRPLYDDGASSATAATRDYVLKVDDAEGALPALNVFGGKITTYRRLSEAALAKLAPWFPQMGAAWTARKPLPGGNFPVGEVEALIARLKGQYAFLDDRWARRLVRAYGTEAFELLGDAARAEDLGRHFGWNLTEREVDWLVAHEWVRSAEDLLWRRSKMGLRLSEDETRALDAWIRTRRAAAA